MCIRDRPDVRSHRDFLQPPMTTYRCGRAAHRLGGSRHRMIWAAFNRASQEPLTFLMTVSEARMYAHRSGTTRLELTLASQVRVASRLARTISEAISSSALPSMIQWT